MAPQRRRWHWYVPIRVSGGWRAMACTTAGVTRMAGREPHRGQLAASRSRRTESAAITAGGSCACPGYLLLLDNKNGPAPAVVPGGAVAGPSLLVCPIRGSGRPAVAPGPLATTITIRFTKIKGWD